MSSDPQPLSCRPLSCRRLEQPLHTHGLRVLSVFRILQTLSRLEASPASGKEVQIVVLAEIRLAEAWLQQFSLRTCVGCLWLSVRGPAVGRVIAASSSSSDLPSGQRPARLLLFVATVLPLSQPPPRNLLVRTWGRQTRARQTIVECPESRVSPV